MEAGSAIKRNLAQAAACQTRDVENALGEFEARQYS
jgi:hypothetical protein